MTGESKGGENHAETPTVSGKSADPEKRLAVLQTQGALIIGGVLGFAVACSHGERTATRIAGDSAVVELRNLQFAPQGIRIRAGTNVTCVNRDAALHNASQIQSKFLRRGDLKEGEAFSFTFDVRGTYRYQCTLHHPNMNGVVLVEE